MCVCARVCVFLFPSSRCVKQRRFCCDEVNGREKVMQVRDSSVMDGAAGSPSSSWLVLANPG